MKQIPILRSGYRLLHKPISSNINPRVGSHYLRSSSKKSQLASHEIGWESSNRFHNLLLNLFLLFFPSSAMVNFGFAVTVPYLLSALLDSSGSSVTSRNLSSSSSSNNNEHVNTSSDFVPRYNGPDVEEMTPDQKLIRDSILSTRKGTGLSGPFGPWLAIPEIAGPAQELGRACRYGTSLSYRESELVILLTGAKTRSHAEFDIHVGEALKAGLTMELINAIPRDDAFSMEAVKEHVIPLLANEREVAIATYTAELVDTYTISDETYSEAKAALDNKDSVLVEITSIAGYYTYVAYTLNAFRIATNKK
jgi:4-carboxymuconolactone decarboxylase